MYILEWFRFQLYSLEVHQDLFNGQEMLICLVSLSDFHLLVFLRDLGYTYACECLQVWNWLFLVIDINL